MLSVKLCRRIAGLLFLTGNISLFVTNLTTPNPWQLAAALVFMSCSVALFLSANHHRWLFWSGAAVIVGYGLVTLSATGAGSTLQHLGMFGGLLGGLLILRGALQGETGKQYPFPYPLNLLDRYPLASAGLIEGLCCLCIVLGAVLGHDWRLAAVSLLWTIAQGFLAASDIPLRQRWLAA